MILEAHRLSVRLPAAWSGRLFERSGGLATLHIADFALPLDDGEFGERSTAAMPAEGSFVAITEYRAGRGLTAGAGLFAAARIQLPLEPTSFTRERLAHARAGQVGTQQFFSTAGRPFCLYLVLAGARRSRRRRLAELNHVLATVRIEPRP